jgi:starch-binding outer membrane protein, SusD/RagB family
MKKFSLYILFVSLGFVSCKKFLDQTPRSQANAEDFYEKEADFEQALNAAYAALRGSIAPSGGNRSAWVMGEMRSDNAHYDYKSSDRAVVNIYRETVANFQDDAFNTETAGKWDANYEAIAKANAILDQIDAASFSEAGKNKIKGEAKFIRALCYFDLVRFYGALPLYLTSVTKPGEALLGRSPVNDVYAQVISDATEALQLLSVPVFPQTGRATKGAALTLLADVHMARKEFAQAEPLLKQVTQLGYALQANFADVFSTSNKNNKESIFEVQFTTAITGQESSFIYWFIPRMNDSKPVTGVATNTITNLGGWNTPTQDLLNNYEPGDKRLDASFAVAEGTYNSNDDFTATAVKSIKGYTPPAGKVGRPFTTKYLHAHTLPGKTNDNWPVYRYAEVLLLLAESLNEQGKTAEALTYLNLVRTRAGLAAATEANQAAQSAIIFHERRVELAFENKRWLDLVRTGRAIPVMTAYGNALKAMFPYIQASAYQVNDNRLLFPIPYAELQYNQKLEQNNGYEQ